MTDQQAVDDDKPHYSGWYVDRDELLDQLARRGIGPQHAIVVGHHVTHRYPDDEIAPAIHALEVVGHAADDRIECVIVRVSIAGTEGATTQRPDGGSYHCTLSRAPDARPVESNALLRIDGWKPIEPFTVTAVPF